MPGGAVGPATEHGQGIAEPLNDLGRFEYGSPGRRQLQRQGHPVKPAAQVDHPVRVVGVEGEARPDLRGPLDEKPDRGQPAQLGQVGAFVAYGRRQGQGRYPEGVLPVGMERLPTGGEHVDPGASGEQRGNELTTGREQVLAVVQHDQQRAAPQLVDQRLSTIGRRAGIQPERLRHRVGHQLRLADHREIDEPHTVGVRRTDSPRGLQRQPGLPAAAGPGQGEQSSPIDQSIDVDELSLPPDQAGQWLWQVTELLLIVGRSSGLSAGRSA